MSSRITRGQRSDDSRDRLQLERLEDRRLLACSDLKSLVLADTEIVTAREAGGTAAVPRYCRITGRIEESINFEIRMPIDPEWNGKFLMFGNGGFAGSIPTEVADLSFVRNGYAVAGTDTGHRDTGLEQTWALNNLKAQEDYGYRAVHLTAVTAKTIVQTFYGNEITHSYFNGCSNGGRQGLMEAQRYPEDFDGIVSGAPALDWMGERLRDAWIQQAMYPNPADVSQPVLPNSKLDLLGERVLSTCDNVDGLADGLIDDPRACSFEPVEDLPLCPDGTDDNLCFTVAQIAAIDRVYDGLSEGVGGPFPGYALGGEQETDAWDAWITDARPQYSWLGRTPNFQYHFAEQSLRYFVFSDPTYELQQFRFPADLAQTVGAAAIVNATDTDLTPFKAAGGKLLIYQGWADHIVSPLRTIEYYEDLTTTMGGAENTTDFARLFMMPGMLHCEAGPGPNRVNWLTALETWVEQDIAPASLIASGGSPSRTRPICPYPERAIWDGIGDSRVADSFACRMAPSWPVGDSNRDGTFNSSDLLLVFAAGQYHDGVLNNSTWETGDWNGDSDFDSSDLVAAFQAGTYVAESSPASRSIETASAVDSQLFDELPSRIRRSRMQSEIDQADDDQSNEISISELRGVRAASW